MPPIGLRLGLVLAAVITVAAAASDMRPAAAQSQSPVAQAVLNDPDAPVSGNPKGDLTIVAFVDYNCPYCKKSAPALDRIVREDGKIRLIYKDWPILGPTSPYGAHLALAAKYQGKYDVAHHALMAVKGGGIATDRMLAAVQASGVDMDQLTRDLETHAADIDALLKRTSDQAEALGFEGTPVYLVGPFRASTLDYAQFKLIVADARAHPKQ